MKILDYDLTFEVLTKGKLIYLLKVNHKINNKMLKLIIIGIWSSKERKIIILNGGLKLIGIIKIWEMLKSVINAL